MKKITISLLFLFFAFNGFSKTWTITNSGFEFTPDSIMIDFGDSVKFNIATFHTALEVSKATWDANGKTALPGFSLPAGGGILLPAQLAPGIHYYVCSNHNDMMMKGIIIVKQILEVKAPKLSSGISVFPNPSTGIFTINMCNSHLDSDFMFDIVDIHGKIIYKGTIRKRNPKIEIDLTGIADGIYFITLKNETEIIRKKIIVNTN